MKGSVGFPKNLVFSIIGVMFEFKAVNVLSDLFAASKRTFGEGFGREIATLNFVDCYLGRIGELPMPWMIYIFYLGCFGKNGGAVDGYRLVRSFLLNGVDRVECEVNNRVMSLAIIARRKFCAYG